MAQHRQQKMTYTRRAWTGTGLLALTGAGFGGGWTLFVRLDGFPGYCGLLLLTVSAVAALVTYEWMQR